LKVLSLALFVAAASAASVSVTFEDAVCAAGEKSCKYAPGKTMCCHPGKACVPNVGCTCSGGEDTAGFLEDVAYDYSFETFVTEFSKTYESDVVRATRKAAFTANLAKIQQHNEQKPASSWKMGLNEFADLTSAEFKATKMGRSKAMAYEQHELTAEEQSNFEEAHANDVAVEDLPDAVDWRTKGVVTPVKNQGGCGSCWAFSTAETVESHLAIKTGKLMEFSEQELVDCVPNPQKCGGTGGCDGATQPLGFQYVAQNGITTEKAYAYTAATGKCKPFTPVANVSSYIRLPKNNYSALMNAVANIGPIAISAAAEPWQMYESGVFSSGCNADVDHAIQMVGYGTNKGVFGSKDYYLVRNSWGASWGEKGYIRIERFGAKKAEPCSTDTKPGDGTACANGPATIQVCGLCGLLSDSSYPTGGAIFPSF